MLWCYRGGCWRNRGRGKGSKDIRHDEEEYTNNDLEEGEDSNEEND